MSFLHITDLLAAAAQLIRNTFGNWGKTLQPEPVRVRNNR